MHNNVIILAAGKGTRMKSETTKVLHEVLGKPMIKHVIDNLKGCGANRLIVVISENAEDVKTLLKDEAEFVVQKEQLGTGHAVLCSEELLKDEEGTTLVVCGDTPLISAETVNNLFKFHLEQDAEATILTAVIDDAQMYGRIIRNKAGNVEKIVEYKDANESELAVKEINTGTFCFKNKTLFAALHKINNNNKQKEYYLTDVIGIISQNGGKAAAFVTSDFSETIGINDRVALAQANKILQKRLNEKWMQNGVTVVDPDHTYISIDTEIGKDTIIYPGTTLNGVTKIGPACVIGPNSWLENATLGSHVTVLQSFIYDSTVGDNTKVGPFAHFRNHAKIGENVRIGNFVEIKNSNFGNNSNAAHLTYIGDADVGTRVNMGCGTITVNYDGKKKYRTVIEDNVFVGCNSNLIAPIHIGKNAYIAAGSTLSKDVPDDALAIARERQVNKEGYAKKYQK